jgi:microtubule-associated protein-like 6
LIKVNAVDTDSGRRAVVSADDFSKVTVYNYPALKSDVNVQYGGHCSHVTNVKFSLDTSYLVSTGGMDGCIMQVRS